MTTKYRLRCPSCGMYIRDRYTNSCPAGCEGLIRAEYAARRITPHLVRGIFRYADWLPVEGTLPTYAGPVTYRSEGLAREAGLENLWICFNGYWPEKGALIRTCSFKELEAWPTMLRLQEKGAGIMQVSSAGNTGRAFTEVSAQCGYPLVLSVPVRGLERIWTTRPAEEVFLVAVDGDYTDAITFGAALCTLPGLVAEGGAKNPARRDGMGTVLLDGTITCGRLPDWYVQAVGSGTGGIAAWEMAERLRADGRWGAALPRLLLSQNLPFTPMADAWQDGRRDLIPEDFVDARSRIGEVWADVLTNRNPPYGVPGGLREALLATNGLMDAVSNAEAHASSRLFAEVEGCDLDPAAAVATASLLRAAERGKIGQKDTVLLNITGGGYERVKEDYSLHRVPPACTVAAGAGTTAVENLLREWVRDHA